MAKYVCSVCGYVHEGDSAPERCPQCKVPAEKFQLQAEGKVWAAEHVVGVAQGAPMDIIEDLRANYMGECTEVGMQVINWLECGKVSSLKQALREWDYETEAKALQQDYFQCQINITAEMAEIDYDINRINERIMSHAQKVRSNINEIEETVEQFKRDVNEKY